MASDWGLAVELLALQLPNQQPARFLVFLESDFVSRLFFFLQPQVPWNPRPSLDSESRGPGTGSSLESTSLNGPMFLDSGSHCSCCVK